MRHTLIWQKVEPIVASKSCNNSLKNIILLNDAYKRLLKTNYHIPDGLFIVNITRTNIVVSAIAGLLKLA